MAGVSQPRIDSQQIDSRQRRELANDRRLESRPVDLEFAAREGADVGRQAVARALGTTDDSRSQSVLGEVRSRSDELLALSPTEYKVVENRLRRMADRQDLQLVKSRRRDRRAPEHGKYMLVDRLATGVPAGGNWSLDLGEVEQILAGTSPAERRVNARSCPTCGTPTHSLSGLVSGALIDDRECPDCGFAFIAGPDQDPAEPGRDGSPAEASFVGPPPARGPRMGY